MVKHNMLKGDLPEQRKKKKVRKAVGAGGQMEDRNWKGCGWLRKKKTEMLINKI